MTAAVQARLDLVALEEGVAELFGPGSSLKDIGAWLEQALDARQDA